MKPDVLLLALAIWLASLPAVADALLQGDLGRWLDDSAAPQLAQTLARHPRFQGETVRLVTLTPGAATGQSNRLARAVESRLRQHLLAADGVRLAVDGPRRGCEAPRPVGYLVRVEVAPQGRRNGRVHIAVVDVAESVWVSGISHQWQGRLSAAELTALQASVNQASPGSAGSPIPLDAADDVARAIKADLLCLLPRDLHGAVFVDVPENQALARVGLALQSELMYESLAAVTPSRADASWLLTLDAADAAADVQELSLTLADDSGGNRQKVAAVFVSSAAGTAAAAPREPPPALDRHEPLPHSAPRAPGLLSSLQMTPAAPEGICDHRRARVNSCVEVSFELLRAAYLFVVSTREHRLAEVSCDGAGSRAAAGPRRFRLRVPPGSFAVDAGATGPDAGFYVLAVRDRAAAAQLQRALAGAPGQCGQAPGRPATDWLRDLRGVLNGQREQIEWRALHVVHDSSGIVAL